MKKKWMTKAAVVLTCLGTIFLSGCTSYLERNPTDEKQIALNQATPGLEVINDQAAFPEGPVWTNGKLYYVEYAGNSVMTWDGQKNSVFWQQDGTGPSAVIPVANGEFLVTGYDSNTIIRISAEGKTIQTYDKDKNGNAFVGPNDFAKDANDGVYFTTSGPWESGPIVGKVYYMSADGTITEVANDLHYANGVAVSPDGKTLYVSESEAHRVIQFDIGEGILTNRQVFAVINTLDPDSGELAYPDGLKVDSKGNLYIGQYSMGRILVVGPDKTLLRTIDVPSPAAPNLNFSLDEATAYVTAIDDLDGGTYMGTVYQVPNE